MLLAPKQKKALTLGLLFVAAAVATAAGAAFL